MVVVFVREKERWYSTVGFEFDRCVCERERERERNFDFEFEWFNPFLYLSLIPFYNHSCL